MNIYHCYILYNQVIDKFYIGYTNDLDKRIVEHNFPIRKRLTYTRKQIGKWTLVYSEVFLDKQDAMSREKEIKGWKSKIMIKKLINNKPLEPQFKCSSMVEQSRL
jgi:putative endonuclease